MKAKLLDCNVVSASLSFGEWELFVIMKNTHRKWLKSIDELLFFAIMINTLIGFLGENSQ